MSRARASGLVPTQVLRSQELVNNIAKHVDMSTKLQTVIKYCVVLIVIVHWTACALKLVTEYTLNECDYEDCPQTILTSTSNYRDGIWAQYVEAAVWALVAINGEASTRTHGEGVLGLLVMLCVEIKILRRVLTRRLLDGVAVPVPRRLTEPDTLVRLRPLQQKRNHAHGSEMDTSRLNEVKAPQHALVDVHTGDVDGHHRDGVSHWGFVEHHVESGPGRERVQANVR